MGGIQNYFAHDMWEVRLDECVWFLPPPHIKI